MGWVLVVLLASWRTLDGVEAAETDFTALSLEDLGAIPVPMVVGASRHEQKATEAPSSVSVVTREEIQAFGHRTLGEILASVRGFYVTSDRGYNHIGVRGFDRLGDYGGRMLLMIDGHRLNDGIYDQASSGTDFPLDVDLIERVEVVRGPAASLYGNNALFWTINVVTRRGSALDGTELSPSYGSLDTWSGRASYGHRFTNGLEFLVSGTLWDSAGQEHLAYPEFVAEGLDGGWARSVFASVSYGEATLQGGYGSRRKDLPMPSFDTVPNSQNPRLFSADTRAWADLRFQHEFGDGWQGNARGYFDSYRYDGDWPYDYDGDPQTIPDVNRDVAVATSAGLDVFVSKTLWERHDLTVGAEWRHDFDLLQRNWDVEPFAEYVDANATADIVGLYAQDEWKVRRDWILNAGLRFDHYSAFGGSVNPRVALIYAPWETTAFKFLYGQAFRAPNAYELYYASTENQPNPDLGPERARSYELVWEQQYGPRWRTGVSLFWNDVEELIDQRVLPGPDPSSPSDDLFMYDNLGAARMRGVEVEGEASLALGMRLRVSYTFSDTEDELTGGRLQNSPEHLGKAGLRVPLWGDRLMAGAELLAMSPRQTRGGHEVGAHALANLTLLSRELVRGLEISASVYNVFDQRFSDPVSSDFYYTGPVSGRPIELDTVQQDGRTFRVKLGYHF